MSLRCGIVGLPNVGKSTLFNALTSGKAESANYPFCTINPNIGVVVVRDDRMRKIADLIKPKALVPTTIDFVDIAGLVKGASQGEGLGNQFLAQIRQTDAIIHVVRCFKDSNIIHVSGEVSPSDDIEVINTELALADLESVEKRHDRIAKTAKHSGDPILKSEVEVIERVLEHLKLGHPVRSLKLNSKESAVLYELHLLTCKPVLYVCNVNETDYANGGNQQVSLVESLAQKEGHLAVMISAGLESEIAQLDFEERHAFLETMGISDPGLNRLIHEAYRLLGLHTFYTAGEKEVRAWTIKQGTLAPQAAGKIHSDFERGFIRAETYHCEDLFARGSELSVREAGLYRYEGKEYIVGDGDIIMFRFNV